MHIGFLPVIIEATQPAFYIDVTHSLTSYWRFVQYHIFCVIYYHTQFISTDKHSEPVNFRQQ